MKKVTEIVNEPLKKRIEDLKVELARRKVTVDEEAVHLRAQVSTLKTQLNQYAKASIRHAEYAAEVVDAVIARDDFDRAPWPVSVRKHKTPITAVFVISDWHIGEVIDVKETEGFGRYNWQIAQDRMRETVTGWIRWVNTLRTGYSIEKAVVVGLGDFISGGPAMHYELEVTNEFPSPVQTAKAAQLIEDTLLNLGTSFEQIDFHMIGADNHSRLTKKPQAKQKALNSMSYLVYQLAAKGLQNSNNISCSMADGVRENLEIGGYKFLSEHGDLVKAWMGIPYYGIERHRAKEALRRMFDNRGFHYQLIAHYHVPWFGSIIMNGSLCGTTEYDSGCGRHAKPSQVAFLVGKHGAFNFVPFTTEV